MLNFNEFQKTSKNTSVQNVSQANVKKEQETKETKNLSDKQVLVNNPSNFVISKGKFAITLAATATLGATIAWSISSGKINNLIAELEKYKNKVNDSLLSETLEELTSSKKTIETLTEERSSALKRIEELTSKLQELQENSFATPLVQKEGNEAVEASASFYRKLISNITSIYDETQAPKPPESYKSPFRKEFTFSAGFSEVGGKRETSFSSSLIERFKAKKSILVTRQNQHVLPSEKALQKALLGNNGEVEDLGRRMQSDLKLAYGKRTGWSDEKIARDIMQNFYDGGDFTLDGTTLRITQLPNGKFKVKIEGDGVFSYSDLKFMGSGDKLENPRSAGGFGEGAKVVIANLFSKGHTNAIKFRSADWEYIFDTQDDVIMRTLNQTPEILNGNSLEFETANEGFVHSLIRSFDFFQHKNNPDFQNLTFENDSFGFRVLDSGQKGNFYLTQRFEYGKAGAWDNNVEGLNLVFKRKPDFKKFEEITGEKFDTGRDRKNMDCDDVYRLIRYFSKEMSDDELQKALLSTQQHWFALRQGERSAIQSFISALCEEMQTRNLYINFDGQKICAYQGENETIQRAVQGLGYRLIDDRETSLNYIGMPSANEIFKKMSHHIALKPTEKEAKKLKILEEAISVIQRSFEETYFKKMKSIFAKLGPEDFKIKKEHAILLSESLWRGMKFDESVAKIESGGLKIIDEDKFAQCFYEHITQTVNNMTELNSNKLFIKNILNALENNKRGNSTLTQAIAQLENLEIIERADVSAPKYIFDKKLEIAKTTLGEAIIQGRWGEKKAYKGHWIDRTYLNTASFQELLATWMHEICHKSGGDGTAEFTYKLTDMIEGLLDASTSSTQFQTKLLALEKVFGEIQQT